MIPSLVIHGGAGGNFGKFTAAELAARRAALHDVLAQFDAKASALDIVTRAAMLLEDCPYFNAGRGAVIAADGAAELDASVMEGGNGKAGGVSAVRTVKNPVLAARAVMERSPHTLFCAHGAEKFARDCGLEIVENDYFKTPERIAEWERAGGGRDFDAVKGLGTIGAVAIDARGTIAAATSTGGLMNKMPGRVSDSSVPGAGTWAQNGVCGVSCTGTGDIFIRTAAARDIAALCEYRGLSLQEACAHALAKIAAQGGTGGVIAIGGGGEIVMDCNTQGMYRGFIRAGEAGQVFILKEEK